MLYLEKKTLRILEGESVDGLLKKFGSIFIKPGHSIRGTVEYCWSFFSYRKTETTQ